MRAIARQSRREHGEYAQPRDCRAIARNDKNSIIPLNGFLKFQVLLYPALNLILGG